jgi:hypothetical protein
VSNDGGDRPRVRVGVAELLAGAGHHGFASDVAGQPAVNVPFIVGWTEHRKVYGPASRAVTS